jgi:hypothetical protein
VFAFAMLTGIRAPAIAAAAILASSCMGIRSAALIQLRRPVSASPRVTCKIRQR